MQLGAESGYATIGVSKNLLAVDGLDRFDVRAAFAALAIDGSRTPQAWQAREASARASATQHTHGLGLSHAHTPVPAHPQLHADSCEHRETGASRADNRTAEGAVSGHSQSALSHLQGDSALLRTHACLTRDRQVPLRGSSGSIWGMALCPGTTSKPIYVSVGERLLGACLRACISPGHSSTCSLCLSLWAPWAMQQKPWLAIPGPGPQESCMHEFISPCTCSCVQQLRLLT